MRRLVVYLQGGAIVALAAIVTSAAIAATAELVNFVKEKA